MKFLGNDWFAIDEVTWRTFLSGVPGVQLVDAKKGLKAGVKVHRTHLPLLPSPQLYATQQQTSPITLSRGTKALVEDQTYATMVVRPDGLIVPNDTQTMLRRAKHLGVEPRWPHQIEDVTFIRGRRGSLIANEMRTGKTVSALMAHDPSEGAFVVIAPKTARMVWQPWLEKFASAQRPTPLRIAYLEGRSFDREALRADYIFAHYNILDDWAAYTGMKIGTLVFDEAHFAGGRKTSRYHGAQIFASQARRVVALTGTPLWNNPARFYTLLQVLNPGAWGSFFAYAKRYCAGTAGEYGFEAHGSSNETEMATRLEALVRRVCWADIADAPPIVRKLELITLTDKQQFTVDQAIDAAEAPNTIAGLVAMRKAVAQAKAERAALIAQELHEPCVIWIWHQATGLKIQERLLNNCFYIDARTEPSVRDRERVIAEWRKTTHPLIISLGVGQTALDLSHASVAIMAEMDWTPAVVSQAEMRTYAPGRPMRVYYLVTDHAIDLKMTGTLAKKCATAQRLGLPAAETAIDMIAEAFGDDLNLDLDAEQQLQLLFSDQESWFGEE